MTARLMLVLLVLVVALSAFACRGDGAEIERHYIEVGYAPEGCEGRQVLSAAYTAAIDVLTDGGETLVGHSSLFSNASWSARSNQYRALEFLLNYQKLLQIESDRGADALCQKSR